MPSAGPIDVIPYSVDEPLKKSSTEKEQRLGRS